MITAAASLPSSSGRPPSPYPGLRPFLQSESSIFFGRERMIDDVIARLAEKSFVFVHGNSGCGKSSLIRAGVLPRLMQEHARHGIAWRTATMRPGSAPLWHLAEAVAQLLESSDTPPARGDELRRFIRQILNQGELALHTLADRLGLGQHANVCLLLDQFEELFTYASDGGRDESEMMIQVVRGFERPPSGIYAIATMRSDHLGDCARYAGLAEFVNHTQYLLPRMMDSDLIRAIREPARLYGGEVTLDLALRLVRDGDSESEPLPLIQYCLMRLWQAASAFDNRSSSGPSSLRKPRQGPRIDSAVYPGLRETLLAHADEILDELEAQDISYSALAEGLFSALTAVDLDGRAVRRPRTFAELVDEFRVPRSTLANAIDRFRRPDCGFLTPIGDCPLRDGDIVDVGHEALIRCWRDAVALRAVEHMAVVISNYASTETETSPVEESIFSALRDRGYITHRQRHNNTLDVRNIIRMKETVRIADVVIIVVFDECYDWVFDTVRRLVTFLSKEKAQAKIIVVVSPLGENYLDASSLGFSTLWSDGRSDLSLPERIGRALDAPFARKLGSSA